MSASRQLHTVKKVNPPTYSVKFIAVGICANKDLYCRSDLHVNIYLVFQTQTTYWNNSLIKRQLATLCIC